MCGSCWRVSKAECQSVLFINCLCSDIAFCSAHDSPHRSTVLPLSSVRLTASMAIGLSTRESASLEAPVLTSHHILQAHSLSKGAGGSKLSTGRVDSTNPPPSVESNKGKKSAADRIAELESKHDLSPKEKMFISRIIRPGECNTLYLFAFSLC